VDVGQRCGSMALEPEAVDTTQRSPGRLTELSTRAGSLVAVALARVRAMTLWSTLIVLI
jgi:hypothetical protein